MSKIIKIIGREIIDSRGNPTVEAEVHTKNGSIGLASSPSGASTGSKEAIELRDNNKLRFLGKGVIKAVNSINNNISKVLLGHNILNQFKLDQIMIDLDGTKNKSNLGGNAILAVSLAIAKAAANFKKIPLYEYIAEINGTPKKFSMPLPMINIINGGKHSDNNIDIQEFMIQPISAKNFKEAIRIGSEIFHTLGRILKMKGINTSVGDEGGYAPNFKNNFEVFDLIQESVIASGYILGKDITFAIDCAASEFFNKTTNNYYLKSENRIFDFSEFTNYLKNLIDKYPITSIEDGMSEFDWNGFLYQTKKLGSKVQLVGDDLFVTNVDILRKGIKKGIANSILIKFNQIGSLKETLKTIKVAKKANYNIIISHRSGETEDTTISDLAVGTASGQIKTGSISRSERVAKYNQLIRIEENLGKFVKFNNLKLLNNFK